MLWACESDVFSLDFSTIIESFEFVSDFLHLLFIAMWLEYVHGAFEVGPGVCDFHGYVDGS